MGVAVFRCRQACERASVCQCACARVCSIILHHSPGSPPEASLPAPSQSPQHVNAPPQLHAPRRSVHQCVLDKRNCHIGGPCTRSPHPCPLCCITATLGYPVPGSLTPSHCAVLPAWGLLSGPFHNILFPQGPQGQGFSGIPSGVPKACLAPHPPHRACVGVAVMASVDIL